MEKKINKLGSNGMRSGRLAYIAQSQELKKGTLVTLNRKIDLKKSTQK